MTQEIEEERKFSFAAVIGAVMIGIFIIAAILNPEWAIKFITGWAPVLLLVGLVVGIAIGLFFLYLLVDSQTSKLILEWEERAQEKKMFEKYEESLEEQDEKD